MIISMPKTTARVIFYVTYIVVLHFGLIAMGVISDLKLLLAFFALGIRDLERLKIYGSHDDALVMLWYACGLFLLYVIWVLFSIEVPEESDNTSSYDRIFEIINGPAAMAVYFDMPIINAGSFDVCHYWTNLYCYLRGICLKEF